jgi:hypothetical protein
MKITFAQYIFHLFLIFGLSHYAVVAQELNCQVTINATYLQTDQTAERAVFKEMEKVFTEFVSRRKWTNDDFRDNEQINCRIAITLRESPTQNVFTGVAQVVATRPVYNTGYETQLLNFNDQNFSFRYIQGQPLFFQENAFNDNLTAMLAFYAYVILAMDYDSFAKLGGNTYIERAFNMLNIAQSSGEPGWERTNNVINRYWLAENLNSQQMIPYREAIYNYHRLGLDTYLADANQAREVIFQSIETMSQVNRLKPSSVLNNIYWDAKGKEIVNIFKDAPAALRKKVRDLLVILDPNKANEYEKLVY